MELKLERRGQVDDTGIVGNVAITPAINEDYWKFRVMVSDKQAIVGFPKFFTTGVGFALEEDWNTNLPYHVPTQEIFNHIKHNKGDDSIPDERCIEAIKMIQAAVHAEPVLPIEE